MDHGYCFDLFISGVTFIGASMVGLLVPLEVDG